MTPSFQSFLHLLIVLWRKRREISNYAVNFSWRYRKYDIIKKSLHGFQFLNPRDSQNQWRYRSYDVIGGWRYRSCTVFVTGKILCLLSIINNKSTQSLNIIDQWHLSHYFSDPMLCFTPREQIYQNCFCMNDMLREIQENLNAQRSMKGIVHLFSYPPEFPDLGEIHLLLYENRYVLLRGNLGPLLN